MPLELRYVVLSRDELGSAIAEFLYRSGRPLPPGRFRKFSLNPEDGADATFEIVRDHGAGPAGFEIEEQDLLSAILMFCKNNRIPIPLKADKRVKPVHDSVALVIVAGIDGAKVPLLARLLLAEREPDLTNAPT